MSGESATAEPCVFDEAIRKELAELKELRKVIKAYDRAINALPREIAIPLINSIPQEYRRV